MSAVSLLTPILNGGIQNVNFVNGRVLTAADMTAERTANLQRQRLLGTCVGNGVACGLEVTLSASSVANGQQVVHVTAGLAVNRNGDVLQLPSDTDLTLTAPAQAATANSGLFVACQPPQTQLSNPGIYVLTVMPASGYQGQVPVTQLNSGGVGTSCTSQYATAGVQFRLAQITLASTGTGLQPTLYALANQIQGQLNNNASAASVAPALSQFRNGLAYACFGVEQLEAYPANPFEFLSQTPSYGLIDQARSAGLLTDCEVDLALLYWTPGGLQFIDMWSVRRRLTHGAITEQWPLLAGDRRRSEAESMFLQFQDQVQSIIANTSDPSSVTADTYFMYLPPAGVVPVTGDGITVVTGTPSTPAFDMAGFFGAHASQDVATTDGDLLRNLFFTALDYEPIQLLPGEIQLYLVWENLQAINAGSTAQLALAFASPAIRYQGIARFTPSADTAGAGTARWGLSRFAPDVI
jgi:hypothetical protein